jgi:signal transduction histidine kinase
MNSIRGRLILCLVGGVLLLEIAAGAGLFAYVEETLEHSFDAALLAKASAIAAAVEIDNGKPRLEVPAKELSESPHRDEPFYFEIWREDGSSLARAGPEGDSDPLPKLSSSEKRFGDVVLPGGTSARATQLVFVPKPDEDDDNAHDPAHTKPMEQLTLIVARDRRSIDQPLAVLLTGLLASSLIIALGIVGIVTWGVRRGLRPLVELTTQVEEIGPATLHMRCRTGGLPDEVRPISEKLNNLLDRLQQAFFRERRFSADVAHELRTPLAELRLLCEVSLRWPDQGATDAVREALAIARQMEETVVSLLSLVRIQAGVDVPQSQAFELTQLVQEIWKPFAQEAEAKQLKVEHHWETPITVRTDRGIFAAATRNLFANAVRHAPKGGGVLIEIAPAGKGATVLIGNTSDSLTADDLPHLCEPFWRKDSARTDRLSTGLGLTIVDEYCRAIGACLDFKLPRDAWFEASVTVGDCRIAVPKVQ